MTAEITRLRAEVAQQAADIQHMATMTALHASSKTAGISAAIVRHIVASLTPRQVDAIRYITPRAPIRKPRNLDQGVCLSGLGRHEIAPHVHATLTEEMDPHGPWSPFRLTALGLAVRDVLEEHDAH